MRNPFSWLTPRVRRLAGRFSRTPKSAPAVSLDQDHAFVQNLNTSRWPTSTQFTYLFRFLGKREGVVFRISLFLLFASAALLVGRYINRHWIPEPTTGGSYTEAIIGSPRYLNPVLATSDVDLELTPLIFNGLQRVQADGTYANDLAQNTTTSSDGKVWTVTLKPNLTWQDGQPLNSGDVQFTFDTIQDPNVASPLYSSARNLKVTTPDDQTVTFTFDKANPTNEQLLTTGILPSHIWSDIPPAAMGTSEYNVKPVGSGPFAFKEITKKEKLGGVTGMTLERFAHATTLARIGTFHLRFVDDATGAVDALAKGQADGARLISTDVFTKARRVRGITATNIALPQVVAAFFNVKNALFTKEVRLALRAATDQQAVIAAGRPGANATNGPVLPGMPGGQTAAPTAQKADLTAATKLLTDAGWAKDGNVFKKKSQSLSFTLTVPDVKEYTDIAKVLVDNWTALGATVTVNAIDPSTIAKDAIKGRQFDVILFSDRYDASLDLYPFWNSTQSYDPGLNLTSYYNKDMDKLLNDSHTTTQSAADEATSYAKVDSAIQADAPAIFLYQSYALVVQPGRLRSTSAPTLLSAANRFLDVASWYVKTKHVWKWNP